LLRWRGARVSMDPGLGRDDESESEGSQDVNPA
jgi:hypothetical protein